MAVFGVDYVLESYATYYFEADSPEEASEIAQKLSYSDSFFDKRLKNEFEVFPIEFDRVQEYVQPFDGEGMEVTLTRDEIDKYLED